MSDQFVTPRGAVPAITACALVVIALGLAVLAWSSLKGEAALSAKHGELYSVALVNGRMLYGRLDHVDRHSLVLTDIYYIQPGAPDAKNRRDDKLVSQRKTDWHAPERAIIPIDKVLMIESVGPDSQVAKLIRQDLVKRDLATLGR